MLPEVGCFSCSDYYVAMASVHTFTVQFPKLPTQALCMQFFIQAPFLMETALPRRLVFFTVVCQTEVFCLEDVTWLSKAAEHPSNSRGAPTGSQGLLASEHTEGAHVSVKPFWR